VVEEEELEESAEAESLPAFPILVGIEEGTSRIVPATPI
jgi:hypothetical protein